jgi:hypothetical protein
MGIKKDGSMGEKQGNRRVRKADRQEYRGW